MTSDYSSRLFTRSIMLLVDINAIILLRHTPLCSSQDLLSYTRLYHPLSSKERDVIGLCKTSTACLLYVLSIAIIPDQKDYLMTKD